MIDASNDLTTLTDPNSHATTFAYNFADRVSTVTQSDNTTEQLTAEQMNGLAAPGTGTPSNPATAVLLATGDQAQFTDANTKIWTTGLDWLGFGLNAADIDPLGDASLNYVNANGLVWMSADALGRRTRDFFDANGNITEEVAADDSTQQYQYNPFSEVTQYTDQENNVTKYAYNSKGDLTQVTDALNDITSYAYNSAGLVTSSTDPNNNITSYAYNTLNELTSTTNALKGVTSYTYDTAGDLASTTDARGFTSTFSYDTLGRLTGQTLPDTSGVFSTSTYTYDKVGNLLSSTDPNGNVTNYAYNTVNELTGVTNPLSQTTTYGYDAVGNQTSVTNPLNQATNYAYNAANELISVTDPLGNQTTYGYDAAGEETSVTDPLGNTFTFDYTVRGEMEDEYYLSPSSGGGMTPQVSGGTMSPQAAQYYPVLMRHVNYAGCGCPLAVVNYPLNPTALPLPPTPMGPPPPSPLPLPPTPMGASSPMMGGGSSGETTSYQRDALHRVVSMTDPMGNTTTYSYDKDGNQTSITDANGHATTYAYNALNKLTSVTDTLGNTTTYGYDDSGDQTSVTNPLGQTSSATFDAQGRVLTQTNPNGGVTKYSYDLAGNLLSLTDPDGNVTSYTYNAANELVSTTNPLGYVSTNAYNAAGELISTTDADGRTIDYGYNAAGQETSETWVGGNYTANYAYNADGQLTSASDPFSSYSYSYDVFGHLASVSNAGTPGVPTVTLSYVYDSLGNRLSLSDSMGGSLSYSYDADNRLTSLGLSVNSTQDAQLSFGYDAASNLTGITRTAPSVGGDTIASSYSYDAVNRLTNITDTDSTKSLTLASYSYGYDKSSNLTSYQDNNNSSLTYSYDTNGELTGASGTLNGSNYSVSYAYDANGNRTMAGYQTGTGNELLSDGTYTYTYDKDGNTLTQTNIATGDVTYYTWDYRNRLTEEKVEDSHGNVLNDEKFTYDVNDNRIGVSLNGVQQLWTVYDGANPYMDFNGSGQLTQRYLTNPNALSQFYGQVSASGVTQWVLTDNLGSIRLVVDSSGNVLDAITYDPYGNIISQTNTANAPRFLYAGGEYDSLTGEYRYGYRVDRPTDGQWLSPDPSGLGPDSNPYRYVLNQPLSLIDASGLQPVPTYPLGEQPALYTGGAYDQARRVYSDRAREHSPADGRRLSQDPLDSNQNSSPYRYMDKDPVNKGRPKDGKKVGGAGTNQNGDGGSTTGMIFVEVWDKAVFCGETILWFGTFGKYPAPWRPRPGRGGMKGPSGSGGMKGPSGSGGTKKPSPEAMNEMAHDDLFEI